MIIFALMALVVVIVATPLRRERMTPSAGAPDEAAAQRRLEAAHDARLRELEAARDAKLREIRDAELDHGTGKLSDEDFARLESELRAEAVEILQTLDELGSPGGRRSLAGESRAD